MAGQPKMAALSAEIERQGGDDVILDRIAAGDRVTQIARDYGVSHTMLWRWAKQNPERKAAYDEARRLSADALVDKAQGGLEECTADNSAQVSLANSKANFYRWLAGVRDRVQYGEEKQVVNIAELHLNALRAYGGPSQRQLEAETTQEAEYTIEHDDAA